MAIVEARMSKDDYKGELVVGRTFGACYAEITELQADNIIYKATPETYDKCLSCFYAFECSVSKVKASNSNKTLD